MGVDYLPVYRLLHVCITIHAVGCISYRLWLAFYTNSLQDMVRLNIKV